MVRITAGLEIQVQKNKSISDEFFCYYVSNQSILINCNFYYLELNLFYTSFNVIITVDKLYLQQYIDMQLLSQSFKTIHDIKARNVLHEIMDCDTELNTYPMLIHSLILKLIAHFDALSLASLPVCSNFLDEEQLIIVEKIKQYVDSRVYDKIYIGDLTKKVGSNKTYVQRWFKTKYGMTIHEYHIREKMDLALKMLQQTNKTLLEIATILNYSNLSNFSNAFKKYYGKYPTAMIRN